MDEWMSGWKDGWKEGKMDGWNDGVNGMRERAMEAKVGTQGWIKGDPKILGHTLLVRAWVQGPPGFLFCGTFYECLYVGVHSFIQILWLFALSHGLMYSVCVNATETDLNECLFSYLFSLKYKASAC